MPVPTTQISLEDVRTELGLSAPTSLSACISAAGKTGVWDKLSDFAGYSSGNISLSVTDISINSSSQSVYTVITSSSTWEAYSWPSFILGVVPDTGESGANIQISVTKNLDGVSRQGIVYFRLISDTSKTAAISINQSA